MDDAVLRAADAAAAPWADLGPARRRTALDAVADALDDARDRLVGTAAEETHLPVPRLEGELRRTTFQLRFLAEEAEAGAHLGVRVDHADPDWPMGAARPDLRRTAHPLGPVLVFAAGNFPFAFSVAGGDTASALAAGCPVVVKAHPGHPGLSLETAEIVHRALVGVGAPEGTFGLISGLEPGRAAVLHPAIRAVAFTGSTTGGRALYDLACGRPDPIPFYGELGSVNPVFVTRTAAIARPGEIVEGYISSVTMGSGQLCTKPGVLLVPADSEIPRRLADTSLPPVPPLLSPYGTSTYLDALRALGERTALLAAGHPEGGSPAPVLLTSSVDRFLGDLDGQFRECFGPASLVVTYDDERALLDVARAIDGQLTAAVHGEADDPIVPGLVRVLRERAGRLLWNQWPTGVSVTHAQQHGGPYPASTAPSTTSVGTAALTRFVRPVAYQGFPDQLLPAELRTAAGR